MNEKYIYCGTVANVFNGGRVGFIRTLTGEEACFIREELNKEARDISKGDVVCFKIRLAEDEATGKKNPVVFEIIL